MFGKALYGIMNQAGNQPAGENEMYSNGNDNNARVPVYVFSARYRDDATLSSDCRLQVIYRVIRNDRVTFESRPHPVTRKLFGCGAVSNWVIFV